MGLRGEPAWRDGFGGPPVVVYARDGERYAIDDRSSSRESVSAPVLAAARGRVVSYKNRLITIDPELVDLSPDRLRSAVEEGLRLQVEHLSASSTSFSLPAWRKWARMTTDTRNAKGWPSVFADGRGIGSAMASIYTNAADGAHLRGLYAGFLEEAADLLARPALRDAAAAWRSRRRGLGRDRRRRAAPGRRAARADRRRLRGPLDPPVRPRRGVGAALPVRARPGDVRGRGHGPRPPKPHLNGLAVYLSFTRPLPSRRALRRDADPKRTLSGQAV